MLTVYPLGDPHIGLFASAEECGEKVTLQSATKDLVAAVQNLSAGAQPTKTGLIVNLGDFFHADNNTNSTAKSGNLLDVDGRWPEIIRAGVRAMQECINLALQKHEKVHVFNVLGNHDEHSGLALAMILEAYYCNEPRVIIDSSEKQFKMFRFGQTLLCFAHGHTTKPQNLEGIMLDRWPKDVGETKYRFWITGHIHHKQVQEYRGCIVESFRTLAAKDAYHASRGYGSGRDLVRITYHREFGEWGRQLAPIALIRKTMNKE